jgi:predicted outer membrane lipoprotein
MNRHVRKLSLPLTVLWAGGTTFMPELKEPLRIDKVCAMGIVNAYSICFLEMAEKKKEEEKRRREERFI